MTPLRSNKGFTLVEMVITVAVMAILVSLSMPAIFEYIRQRDSQREEVALAEIRKAIEAYLSAKGTLPSDTLGGANVWYKQLAGYTSLSEKEIMNDVYGRPRMYIRYENDDGRSMQNTSVKIVYATVHSMGVNGKAENKFDGTTIAGISLDTATNPVSFKAASDGKWWKGLGGTGTPQVVADKVVSIFSGLRAGGDDHLMRFTNYSEVLDRYKLTVQRLDTLTQALETYARSKYAERVSWCVTRPTHVNCNSGTPEKLIYYPRSEPTAAINEKQGTTSSHNVMYLDGNTIRVKNNGNEAARKKDMEGLMDLLGLPRDNCCSALTGNAFYYFSNPRPRAASGCGNRPRTVSASTPINEQKLPARVTTDNPTSTCG